MTSGIYQLTFGNGSFYIGQSNNIERRWEEHWKKFMDGKAAGKMQQAFAFFGYPRREVVELVHQDHLDIAETYWINRLWGAKILNTTRPYPLTKEEYEDLSKMPEALTFSTVDMVRNLYSRGQKIKQLQDELDNTNLQCDAELEKIKSGTKIPELEYDKEQLKKEMNRQYQEIRRLKNRGFFDRLFNN